MEKWLFCTIPFSMINFAPCFWEYVGLSSFTYITCLLTLCHMHFCPKLPFWRFWRLSGWTLAKLALIWSKMHLWHDSLPFLPLASRFRTFWLGHVQKSKFWDEKVIYVFRLFDFWIFFTFPFSPFLFFLLQWLTFCWACLQFKNF